MPQQPTGTVTLPPDSTGKVLAMVPVTVGTSTVQVQGVALVDENGTIVTSELLEKLDKILRELSALKQLGLVLASAVDTHADLDLEDIDE